MATVYRIKNLTTSLYWGGGNWAQVTGTIYTTKELAEKSLKSHKLQSYKRTHNAIIEIVPATITDEP